MLVLVIFQQQMLATIGIVWADFLGNKDLGFEIKSPSTGPVDLGLDNVIQLLANDKKRIWNSVELFQEYLDGGGSALTRCQLIEKLSNRFQDELIVLSCTGYANIVTFHNNTTVHQKLIKEDDKFDITQSIKNIAKQIVQECKSINHDSASYLLHMNKELAADSVSPTLQSLLSAVSKKFDQSLPALMIGSIVTSMVMNRPTDLQIALGVLMRDSKTLINHMYDYRVTCSYSEVLRFKKSAAVIAAKEPKLQGITSADQGLVQVIADNFDADISCPNGKLSTHSLAMIIMQPSCSNDVDSTGGEDLASIARLPKAELQCPIEEEDVGALPFLEYQKKPAMSQMPVPNLTDQLKEHQDVNSRRAQELDLNFMQDIISEDNCPEFIGYNTKICREQGHKMQPKTKIVYLPLIDKPPSAPETIASALIKARQVSEDLGQGFVVFIADQQLYKVALHLIWQEPDAFSNVYLRLGGMHLLMSYIGCVGTLMTETGIVEILSATFGGVIKMLKGKKYPENVRALRMLTEEVLRPILNSNELDTMESLVGLLHDLSTQSMTANLWVDCLIWPVFHMLKYIRAEREADWALHLAAVCDMMPLFFAAGHTNYARFGMYYLR